MLGISWESFKNVDKETYMGSKRNPKSIAYHFQDGAIFYSTSSLPTYGQEIKQGDVITVNVDMNMHTLSFEVNGKDFGIALSTVPSEGVWFSYQAYCLSTEVQIV